MTDLETPMTPRTRRRRALSSEDIPPPPIPPPPQQTTPRYTSTRSLSPPPPPPPPMLEDDDSAPPPPPPPIPGVPAPSRLKLVLPAPPPPPPATSGQPPRAWKPSSARRSASFTPPVLGHVRQRSLPDDEPPPPPEDDFLAPPPSDDSQPPPPPPPEDVMSPPPPPPPDDGEPPPPPPPEHPAIRGVKAAGKKAVRKNSIPPPPLTEEMKREITSKEKEKETGGLTASDPTPKAGVLSAREQPRPSALTAHRKSKSSLDTPAPRTKGQPSLSPQLGPLPAAAHPPPPPPPFKFVRPKAEKKRPSLATVLMDSGLKKNFYEFLEHELATENIQFLDEAENFANAKLGPEQVRSEAQRLYKKYIPDGAPAEVNIGSTLKGDVKKAIFSPESGVVSQAVFEGVSREIRRLLEQNFLTRWHATNKWMEIDFEPYLPSMPTLNVVLRHNRLRQQFEWFLRQEHQISHLELWTDAEAYAAAPSAAEAQRLLRKHQTTLGWYAPELPGEISQRVTSGDRTLFARAQSLAHRVLEQKWYSRWVVSQTWTYVRVEVDPSTFLTIQGAPDAEVEQRKVFQEVRARSSMRNVLQDISSLKGRVLSPPPPSSSSSTPSGSSSSQQQQQQQQPPPEKKPSHSSGVGLTRKITRFLSNPAGSGHAKLSHPSEAAPPKK